jgi:hypothetical protein
MTTCIWCRNDHDGEGALCDDCQRRLIDRVGTTSGRCPHCRIRFVWSAPVRIKRAACPHCHSPLRQTTHLWQGATQAIRAPEIHGKGRIPVGVRS